MWVDGNFKGSIRRLGNNIVELFVDDSIKLVALFKIREIKKFFKHLFMIRYKQRTEKYLKKFCIVIFSDFSNIKDLYEYNDIVDYFKQIDLRISCAIYSPRIDKSMLNHLKKIDDSLIVLNNSNSLAGYIKGTEDEKEKIANMSIAESNNSQMDYI